MNRTIRPAFTQQAEACRVLGSPLYATILAVAIDDIEHGGPVADVVSGFEGDAVPAAVALRFLGGLHRLVLLGDADRLARHFPSVGGTPDAATLPSDVLETVEAHRGYMVDSLAIPPQTNEIGRSMALLPGILHALDGRDLPVDLLEIGSSAGLNLMLDRFSYDGGTWKRCGDERAPTIASEWRGAAPPMSPLHVRSRRGSDLDPVDLTDAESRVRLLSFVWADQLERFERMRAAMPLASGGGIVVERADAVRWLEDALGDRSDDAHTVVMHSVMWQYLDPASQQAIVQTIRHAGRSATVTAPLSHVRYEPRKVAASYGGMELTVTTWPGGEDRVLAHGHPHGSWITWLGGSSADAAGSAVG